MRKTCAYIAIVIRNDLLSSFYFTTSWIIDMYFIYEQV